MRRIANAGLVAAGLGAALLLAAGCVHSRIDATWGEAYAAVVAAQIDNPDAPAGYDAVEGLDPETARRVAARYYKGQVGQKTRRAPAVLIGEIQQ